ncbi:MAG: Asp-tRNA(Asn)/Glu-tRNA(Gln) amidotransferase subunit GatA [Bacteroidota bacterium]
MYSSIQTYHQHLIAGQTTCVAAVEYFLKQIEANRQLNAFTEVYREEALQRAEELDRQRNSRQDLGRLHGVVIAIKDVICYKGKKVTAASAILENFESIYHATAVQRLLDEEAIIIGSCNCDEFAMGSTNENSVYGKVLNAIDESRVPGGSSGGSAVAVQSGCCMLSLGSDTGGSVRQPADFCGIIGLKPSYGYISRYGLIAYASSFDQIGIFGRQIDDIALVLQVMGGPDAYDSTAIAEAPAPLINSQASSSQLLAAEPNKKYKIAYFEEAIQHPSLDAEIAKGIQDCLASLKENGHEVSAVPFQLLEYIVPTYYVLTTAEASTNLSRYDGVRYGHRTQASIADLNDFYCKNRTEGFGTEVQRRIMLGTFVLSAGYYDAYFGKAQQVRQMLVQQTKAIFEQYDAIILPTAPTTAFPIGEKTDDPIAMYLADIYTVFANLTGVPGISIPLFKHSNGMPFGLQILANRKDELTLLQLSDYLLKTQQKAAVS